MSRLLGRGALAVLGLGLVILGLTGTISGQLHSFTATKVVPVTDPSRLLSTNSGNRWVWWKEAAGAFSDQPIGGWGAGSFPVTHLLYREPPALNVRQPHNVPLQLLAETGIVGALLALGAIGVLLAAAIARVRRLPPGRDRALAGACVAAALAWLVHGLVDWDWDIPGVTLPALLLLAVAVAATPPSLAPDAPRGATPPGLAGGGPSSARAAWPALLALAGVTLALAAFAASAILPDLSQSKAQDALAEANAARTPAQLARAQATAELAARLNPLAVQPLLDAAVIADRRLLRVAERDYLLRAVARGPYDAVPWDQLAYVAVALGDRAGLLSAVHQALAVDPIGSQSLILAATAEPYLALAQNSATATGTPLPTPDRLSPAALRLARPAGSGQRTRTASRSPTAASAAASTSSAGLGGVEHPQPLRLGSGQGVVAGGDPGEELLVLELQPVGRLPARRRPGPGRLPDRCAGEASGRPRAPPWRRG